ncbi:MAG: hypothetical protein ACYTFG_00275 [Planctomycetota bacterium]|jgi:hypothetical protein
MMFMNLFLTRIAGSSGKHHHLQYSAAFKTYRGFEFESRTGAASKVRKHRGNSWSGYMTARRDSVTGRKELLRTHCSRTGKGLTGWMEFLPGRVSHSTRRSAR